MSISTLENASSRAALDAQSIAADEREAIAYDTAQQAIRDQIAALAAVAAIRAIPAGQMTREVAARVAIALAARVDACPWSVTSMGQITTNTLTELTSDLRSWL